MGLQPLIAEIAVLLVLEHRLLVDDRADAGREAVQDEGGREILGDGELDGRLVGRLDQVLHIVLGPAELGEDEGRGLVEQDHPLQREGDVLGRHRIAGMELLAGPDLQRDRLAVVADGVALGNARDQVLGVLGLEGEDAVIDVGDHLASGEFEHLGRVEGDDVVDLLGDDEGILGRLRQGRLGKHGETQQAGGKHHLRELDHDFLPEARPPVGATVGSVRARRPPRHWAKVLQESLAEAIGSR